MCENCGLVLPVNVLTQLACPILLGHTTTTVCLDTSSFHKPKFNLPILLMWMVPKYFIVCSTLMASFAAKAKSEIPTQTRENS